MEIADSLEFLDENWDFCMKEEDLESIKNPGKMQALSLQLSAQAYVQRQELMKQCMSSDYSVINESESKIKTTIDALEQVQSDLNRINLIEQIDQYQSKKDNPIVTFCNDMIKIDRITKSDSANLALDFKNSPRKNIQIIKDFIFVERMYHKYQVRELFTQLNGSFNFSFTRDALERAFTAYTPQNIELLQHYYEYFVFFSQISNKSSNYVHELHDELVKKSAEALFNRYFGSFAGSQTMKIQQIFSNQTFDFDHPKIQQLLNLTENDVISPNFFNAEDLKQVEFALIKFLVELPNIVQDRYNFFNQVFMFHRQSFTCRSESERCRILFQDTVKKLYFEFFNQIFQANTTFSEFLFRVKNPARIQKLLFWIFVHRMTCYIELTTPLAKEPFTEFISSIYNDTSKRAKQVCNDEYDQLDIRKFCETEINKQNTGFKIYKSEQIAKSLLNLFTQQIIPILRVINSCYYEITRQSRETGEKWYSNMMSNILNSMPNSSKLINFSSVVEDIYSDCTEVIKNCNPQYAYYFYSNALYHIFPFVPNKPFYMKPLNNYLKNKAAKPSFKTLFFLNNSKESLAAFYNDYEWIVQFIGESISEILKSIKSEVVYNFMKNELITSFYNAYSAIYNQSNQPNKADDRYRFKDPNAFVSDFMQFVTVK